MLAPHEAPNLPRLRSGLRRGAPCLQIGCVGPWGGALTEVRRHFKPADAALALGGLGLAVYFGSVLPVRHVGVGEKREVKSKK